MSDQKRRLAQQEGHLEQNGSLMINECVGVCWWILCDETLQHYARFLLKWTSIQTSPMIIPHANRGNWGSCVNLHCALILYITQNETWTHTHIPYGHVLPCFWWHTHTDLSLCSWLSMFCGSQNAKLARLMSILLPHDWIHFPSHFSAFHFLIIIYQNWWCPQHKWNGGMLQTHNTPPPLLLLSSPALLLSHSSPPLLPLAAASISLAPVRCN